MDHESSSTNATRLGSVGGIPITVHWTFFLLLGIEFLSSLRHGGLAYITFVFLLYGPVLFVTVLLHELGHGFATKSLGGVVEGIVLWPLGGFTLCGPTDGGASADLKVAVAGPLTHIPQSLFWMGIYAAATGGGFPSFSRDVLVSGGINGFFTVLSAHSFWLNVDLMVFNLFIPAYPLDGGRCMAAGLIMYGFGAQKAAQMTSITSMIIAAMMAFWGLVSFIHQNHPAGLFAACVGFYVFSSGSRLYNLATTGRLRDHPLFGRPGFEDQDEANYVPLGSS
uniref:Peptidase M50 domain-containing protein n=1 Tax=Trieres chinensis TaxID=1514140 RepID=A0A7S2ER85_TRICV|mmetsp:Transcript_35768/g.73144  ORF Transcript_35768/g.73144 Transcript_35768/m.73144 type:complete len:280 (+) Transcript_35768:72-911(+)|eukprot:CAMPEP_0183308038 /NCGR_PEP_ID=MMETSP0160_2-20130417/19708_1 /TAXON_ID=2839 ORGANISM="Odontella Sinensis, Strain Grunow 1884" /NCGR_SAMPLE_ID=MMETSP0160_2 /ASSEMBLY_ACC=CAM_ASM_000250 /LENGTH=279 /DNA_ID=CAMNT_0025471781 /DNA_START=27 /DNA_END=866 /DNA_ORIENTATION=-